MKMVRSPKARLYLLLLVLLASAVLTAGGRKTPAQVGKTSEAAPVSIGRGGETGVESLDLSVLNAREGKKDIRDVFVDARPESPSPPPVLRKEPMQQVENEAPASPQAPPLPLRYLGRMNNGVPKVFLAKGDVTYTVAVADVIDNTYRLDEITEEGLNFTYLPLNQQQTLNFQTESESGSWPSRAYTKTLR